MLQLAAPLGLLALGALLVPIAIHLVRRPLRVVRVGNLRFLQAERRPVRSLRWHEWLLLALRCALLAALALSLAGPGWQPRAPRPARWLLLVPGATLDAATRAEWEQRRREGFEPRVLANGFPLVADATVAGSADVDRDAWSLLREADQRLPAGSRVVVFGPTRASQFRGSRPTLTNVEAGWRATSGEAPVVAAAARARVALVAAADREEDARYLRAALAAIGALVVTDDTAEWLFQLGEAPLPPAWSERVQRGARLVTDAPNAAAVIGVARWFDVGADRVHVRQRVASTAGAPVLRDSAGEALLTEERQGAGLHWRFALRFHPDWTDWPLESALPAWWRAQFQPANDATLTIAPEQAAPRFVPASVTAAPSLGGFGRIDLRGGCWLLAVALFASERVVSLRAQRRRANA